MSMMLLLLNIGVLLLNIYFYSKTKSVSSMFVIGFISACIMMLILLEVML